MTDTANLDNFVRSVNEEESVIGDPEPQFFHIALQRFEVANAELGEAVQGMKHTNSRRLVEFTDVGLGLLGPLDPYHAGSW